MTINDDILERMWQRIIFQAFKDLIDSKTSDQDRVDAILFLREFYFDAVYYVQCARIDIDKLNKLIL